MIYTYKTRGVCSRMMEIAVGDDGTVEHVEIVGGCNGNLQGLSKLVQGMKAADVIERLQGIDCEGKGTSCPDQLARALRLALEDLHRTE